MRELFLIGVSHQSVAVALRERVALAGDALKAALSELVSREGVDEAMILSTCNRVEVYVFGEGAESARRFFLERLPEAARYLSECRGEEAVRHLFRVAASLESMVLGEQQILGQVKEAYGVASAIQAAGPFLSRLCNRAFVTAKRVRTETGIGQGLQSMSQVAVELVRKIFGSFEGHAILLLGAGKMGTLSAKALISLGADRVLVANRSFDRAVKLAEQTRGVARRWEELKALLVEADVVIVATGAAEPVVTFEMAQTAMKARRNRSMCFVDLSVPRNVDTRCAELDNLFAYDVDDLQAVVQTTKSARLGEARRGEAIVELEVKAFAADCQARAALPVLAALRRRAEAIARQEVERTLAQVGSRLDEKGRRSIEAMGRAIVNKLLHAPTARLKEAVALGDGALPGAAATLFGIEDTSRDTSSEGEEGPAACSEKR